MVSALLLTFNRRTLSDIALAAVRMTRERFLPMEKNIVSRRVSRVYEPTLRWILAHKKTFLLAPLTILTFGITIWLGIGTVLKPVEWLVNLFAPPSASELAIARGAHAPPRAVSGAPAGNLPAPGAAAGMNDAARVAGESSAGAPKTAREARALPKRPLLEVSQLRWQTVRRADGPTHRRMLWRTQTDTEREREITGGLSVVRETRILPGIGREFMPPLDEGSFLYMPSLLPQAGLGPAVQVNSIQDRAIASVPEVESVVGKLGRAESALDPAPIGMIESIIILKPEDDWRQFPVKRWFSGWPAWVRKPLAFFAPETRKISKGEILTELQEKTAIRDVQDVIEIAIGGMNLMESVEGRERYPIRVRYQRAFREDIPELENILVPTSSGAQVPLAQVVTIKSVLGPPEIKGERGLLVGYVTMNTRERDEISVVEDAEATLQAALRDGTLKLPAGY